MDTNQKTIACPQCGAEIPVGTHTCPNCGKGLIPSMYLYPESSTQDKPGQEYEMVPGGLWFQKRVLHEAEPDEKFINSYTYGPGCWIYLCSRVFWPLAILGFIISGICRMMDEARAFDAYSVSISSQFVVAYIGLLYIILLIWLGKVARRKRWERMNWKSFAHFRSDEKSWNAIGIIAWIITIGYLIYQLFVALISFPYP